MGINVENVNVANATTTKRKDNEDKNKVGFLATTASVGAGYLGYKGVERCSRKLSQIVSDNFMKESMFSSYILNGKECRELFKASALKEKGMQLVDCADKAIHFNMHQKYNSNLKGYFKGKTSLGELVSSVKGFVVEQGKNATVNGANAFFYFKENKIFYNSKKLGMALPHEMGHAINSTNLIGKTLQKSRGVSLLAIPILAVALLRRPTDKKGESETFVGKSLDFVKDNCVALTAVTQVPMLLEEGLASINAAKLGKKFLDPTKAKAINSMNKKAFLTYLVAAGVTVAGVWIANKIRNWTAKDTINAKEEQVQKQDIERQLQMNEENVDIVV